jgi:hypothetical protein
MPTFTPPIQTEKPTLIAGRIIDYLEAQEKQVDDVVLKETVQRMRQVMVRDLMQPRDTRAGKESNTLYSGACARKARLTYDGAGRDPLRARTVLKFLLGDLVELSVLAMARLAGCHIEDNNRDLTVQGEDGVLVPVHPDGRFMAEDDTAYNVEIKSCDSYTFDSWLDQGGPDDAWGYLCVPLDTEILTIDGWKTGVELNAGDMALGFNHKTHDLQWEAVSAVNRYPDFNDELLNFKHLQLDMSCTAKHRVPLYKVKTHWIKEKYGQKKASSEWEPIVVHADEITASQYLKLPRAGNYQAPNESIYENDFVELVGWFVTEGHVGHRGKWSGNRYTGTGNKRKQHGMLKVTISQKDGVKGDRIKRLASIYGGAVYGPYVDGMLSWNPLATVRDRLLDAAPRKELQVRFICQLTRVQLQLLFDTMVDGDGTRSKGTLQFWQKNAATRDAFEVLCVLLGHAFRTSWKKDCDVARTHVMPGRAIGLETVKISRSQYQGMVWCPVLPSSFWVARRNGRVFITGNTQASMEVQAWREAGVQAMGTLFIAVSTGSRQGSIAEFLMPYDEQLVVSWHERRLAVQQDKVPEIPFSGQPEMAFMRGKACNADWFVHGEPTPRLNEKGATYGWDVMTGRVVVPLICSYCDFMAQHCWKEATMELDGTKPIWVLPATSKAVPT